MTVPAYITAPNWIRIVQDYTARNLTFEDDKLPAISGIAGLLKSEGYRQKGDQYLTGLWKDSLHYEILWVHRNLAGGPTTPKSRPRAFRAPSWSWVPLDGNVGYPEITYLPHAMQDIDNCELVAHEIEVKGSNPFGRVAGGWIKLKGRMGRVRVLNRFLVNWSGNTFIATHSLDMCTLEAVDRRDVWCFLIRGEIGLILTHRRPAGPNHDPYHYHPEFRYQIPIHTIAESACSSLVRGSLVRGIDLRFYQWKEETVTIF